MKLMPKIPQYKTHGGEIKSHNMKFAREIKVHQ